ncbi:(SSU ribosomal protein S18P)-alanine acetyltransferase [Shewanella psychrophila]|uniref:[Ribosomal protein bS18]-alanine N-acetyltransferase n=1 Tax=Shewanella psychrophila TaxID=225848 RepID=A0A1S6HV91_9GAMM|nr:ribosomal protein S18-alanine N-acetyltransferase [Shewanella psychrophila]AQS39475.1 (SSU ribosomal protein S18P)-alanine acetyltransferase [Shewanella psychrophila]
MGSSHQVHWLSPTDAAEMFRLVALAHSHPMSLGTIETCFGSLYSSLGILVERRLVGCAILHQIFEDATLIDICVDPSEQGKGYGQNLLQAVIANAVQSKAETLFLEVRASSMAARHLYLKHGFKESGIRKGYYKTENGNEDAILMELDIKA